MGKKKQNKELDYIVYTDGGCAWNPGGPGGCAAVVIQQNTHHRKELHKGYHSTTNNRMEIMAVIIAMEEIPSGSSVLLHSDSQYVVNTISGQFRKKKNQDLWDRLDQALAGKKVYLKWVKGHSGIPENERCDQLCQQAIKSPEKETDAGYGDADPVGLPKENRESREHTGKSGGAMGVEITLPDPYASERFSFCSKEEYCEKYSVREPCAGMILNFYRQSKSSFRDYMELKSGGIDFWSRKSMGYIQDMLGEQGMTEEDIRTLHDAICQYVEEEKDMEYCLRWYMRGLPLRDAIRKTLVMQEVRENCY